MLHFYEGNVHILKILMMGKWPFVLRPADSFTLDRGVIAGYIAGLIAGGTLHGDSACLGNQCYPKFRPRGGQNKPACHIYHTTPPPGAWPGPTWEVKEEVQLWGPNSAC